MIIIKDLAAASLIYAQKLTPSEEEALAFTIQTWLMTQKGIICEYEIK